MAGRYRRLNKDFFLRSTINIAKELVGKIICRKWGNRTLMGMIVETEAYPGINDPASHTYIGKTKRNESMFEEGGIAYVYFTYGNHYCFNVVTGLKDKGSGVLIRGVEPLDGIDIMMNNRNVTDIYNLTNGPGKFAHAFGIDKNLNAADLLNGNDIFLLESEEDIKHKIAKSKRIGITKNTEKLYRFYIIDNPFVSGAGRAVFRKKNNDNSS
ncbi:MAG: DNA-3-methyladenine glycosylase [Ignavibacteriae bacterium]|nr:MAG: DNA-3-methyladenine glycosylase [Ignavibacteriota bacterium]